MKKTMTLLMTCLVMMCMLAACGSNGGGGEVTASPEEIVKDLAENAVTDKEALSPISADILASTYFLAMDKVEESVAYLSTGASASEAAVVKCKDSSYAQEVEKLFKTRVENQTTLFADYAPEEVKKLGAAIIKSSGNYVVLFVGEDTDKANDILSNAGF